jgi:hypothetical protein
MRNNLILCIVAAASACSSNNSNKEVANRAGRSGGETASAVKPPGAASSERKHILEDVNIVGTYDVRSEGANAPGDGKLTLEKISGEAYRGQLAAGGKTYRVAAFRNGDLLALAWSEAKDTIGAASMELYCDLSLEARLAENDAGSPGKALITGGNSSFSGTWTVNKGTIPGRNESWSGKVSATALSANVVTFAVKSSDNGTDKYLLIRRGDVLGGGYRYDKKPFVAAHLRIGGGGSTLDGSWVASTDAAGTAQAIHLKRQGPPGPNVALKPAGASTTPSGVECLDVPEGGHKLFAKKGASSGGGGGGGACSGGRTSCGGSCVDLLSDPQNCGACGKSCSVRLSLCKQGSCDCFQNEKDNNGGVCP